MACLEDKFSNKNILKNSMLDFKQTRVSTFNVACFIDRYDLKMTTI